MPRNEVFSLIDKLSLSVQNARKVPLTGLVMIEQNEALELLKRVVSSYDPQLEKADIILNNEKNIIDDANATAERVTKEADLQAQSVVNEANSYAQNTRASADAYAAETSHQAEEKANAMLADAQARARQTVEDAQAHADTLVSETTVLARAQEEAENLLKNANEHAAAVERQTQQDMLNILSQLESNLDGKLNDVRMMLQSVKSMRMYSEENENI